MAAVVNLKMLERKQREGMCAPVMQRCHLAGPESARCMVATSGKGGENSHHADQVIL